MDKQALWCSSCDLTRAVWSDRVRVRVSISNKKEGWWSSGPESS